MTENYFNLQETENTISYQPYKHDTADSVLYMVLGFVGLVAGLIFIVFHLNQYAPLAMIIGAILLGAGFCRLAIREKIILCFDRQSDSIYKKSILGTKKLMSISDIYSIITVSENMSYTYCMTSKKRASAKPVEISSFFTSKREKDKKYSYFQEEILPRIYKFTNLD